MATDKRNKRFCSICLKNPVKKHKTVCGRCKKECAVPPPYAHQYCMGCWKPVPTTDFDQKVDKIGFPTGELKAWCRPCCAREVERQKQQRMGVTPPNNKGRTYASRDQILRGMGYNSYQEYLKSDLYALIRRKVFAQKGANCRVCSKQATELHHNRYSRKELTGKSVKFINPICRECHEKIEFEKGEGGEVFKNSLANAHLKYRKLRRERHTPPPNNTTD